MSTGSAGVRDVDALVVGLGAMGSAALYHLALAGVQPVGLDQYAVGHDRGSSHGRSRVFRLSYPEPDYVELARSALPLWRELEERSGARLLTLCGMVSFAGQGNAEFAHILTTLEDCGVEHERLDAEAVSERFPVLRIPADAHAYFSPEAGFLDAEGCVRTHVEEACRAGAVLADPAKLTGLDLSAERPLVTTSQGRYRCRRLVLAPGPWAADLLAELHLPITVTRQQWFYFVGARPELYGPDQLCVYSDYDALVYGFPHEGPGLKVADDHVGEPTSPETIDRSLDAAQRDRLRDWLARLMPGLDPTPVEGATCMYSLTPDRDFIVGSHPQNPAVQVAAGFSGHGFKFATLIGRILGDLATEGSTPYPIERFRPERFAPAPGDTPRTSRGADR